MFDIFTAGSRLALTHCKTQASTFCLPFGSLDRRGVDGLLGGAPPAARPLGSGAGRWQPANGRRERTTCGSSREDRPKRATKGLPHVPRRFDRQDVGVREVRGGEKSAKDRERERRAGGNGRAAASSMGHGLQTNTSGWRVGSICRYAMGRPLEHDARTTQRGIRQYQPLRVCHTCTTSTAPAAAHHTCCGPGSPTAPPSRDTRSARKRRTSRSASQTGRPTAPSTRL